MITIRNRYSGEPICEGDTLALAIAAAPKTAIGSADLRCADLRYADLRDADLCGADLCGADLCGANLCGADLRYAIGLPQAPAIAGLDKLVLERIEVPGALEMGTWHTCATTHCLAGWAITLAGEAGARLEQTLGPAAAGALIFHDSTGSVPNFYGSNEEALAEMRKRAGAT